MELRLEMTTCVERCSREFAGEMVSLFGRVLTGAECERMARQCNPCNPDTCVVTVALRDKLRGKAELGV